MRKYLISMLFLSLAIFSQSNAIEPSGGPEVELTLINSTKTDVRINVKEELTKNPYTYETVLEIKLAPGEAAAMPVSLAATNETIRKLYITAKGDLKYEKGGSLTGLELDIANSNHFVIQLWEGSMPKLSHWHFMRIGAELLEKQKLICLENIK